MAVKSSPSKPAARQPRPSNLASGPPRPPRNNDRFAHDLWGIGLFALGVVALVSLAFQSHAGAVGGALAAGLRALVGVGAFLVPPLLAAIGVMLIQGREQHTRTNFAGGAAFLFFVGIALWHLLHSSHADEFQPAVLARGGGYVGAAVCAGLRACFHDLASGVILLALAAGGIVWATDMRLLHLFEKAAAGAKRVGAPVAQGARAAKQGAAALRERARKTPTPASPPLPHQKGRGANNFKSAASGQEAEPVATGPSPIPSPIA